MQTITKQDVLAYKQEMSATTGIRIRELCFITAESLHDDTVPVQNKGKFRDVLIPDSVCLELAKYCAEKQIASGVGTSINEIIHAFEVNKIKLPEVIYLNFHKADVKRMILDCTKLQGNIDHKCINITQGISLFWKYTKRLK